MSMNMNMNEPMTTITMRPQGGRGGSFGPWDGEELQPVEFCITPEFAEILPRLLREAAVEDHLQWAKA